MSNLKNFAVSLTGIGELSYTEIPYPTPNDDEVIVKIMRCGICGSDIDRVFKNGTYHFPTVPGHEFSGIVVYDKTGLLTGMRVAVFPLLPCFSCDKCKIGNYACCDNYDYYGSRRDGGFSEYLAVKKFNLVPLPDNVTYEVGALCEPMAVAFHACRKLGNIENKKVLVSGAGTIGLIVARILKAKGAKAVYFIENDASKIEFLENSGFYTYNGQEDMDCGIEGTGVDKVLVKMINAVKASNLIVLMGNPSRPLQLSAKEYQQILRKELVLCGMWNSSYAVQDNDWRGVLELVSNGQLVVNDLVTHIFSLPETVSALELMKGKQQFYIKVMISNEK